MDKAVLKHIYFVYSGIDVVKSIESPLSITQHRENIVKLETPFYHA